MSLGNPVGEFEFESKGIAVSEQTSGGGGTLSVNYEGVATGYGVVVSTVDFTVEAAGDKSGTISARNVAWLENGDSMSGEGTGVFSESGVNTWRVRSFFVVSDGTVLLSDGEVSLAERSYKGKMYAWE